MDNYKEEREKNIRKILTYVCENKALPPNAYDWDTSAVIKECVDGKFLENVQTVTTMDGHVRVTTTRPFVTKLGLDFLNQPPYKDSAAGRQEQLLKDIAENTESLEVLKRIANTAEKEADSAKKDAKFSKIISVLALLVSMGSLITAIVVLAIGH